MPTYRLTVTSEEAHPDLENTTIPIVQILEVFAEGTLMVTVGKTPAELKHMSDWEKRGAVIVNLPPGSSCKFERVEDHQAVAGPPLINLSHNEAIALEAIRTASWSILGGVTGARDQLLERGLVKWSPIEGWGLTKAGRHEALRRAANKARGR